MSIFSSIEFVNPAFLWLLLALPLIAVWYTKKTSKQVGSMTISEGRSIVSFSNWRTRLYPIIPFLRLIAAAFVIIALARPQTALKEEEVRAEGIDIVLAMDISSSMLAQDFEPDRLSVSKQVAKAFVDKRVHDRIGLVVFSGESFTQCPLTTDHRVVKDFLESLQCGILNDGTAIGMGLASAVNRMKDSESKSKVVILLTDGVNNSGYIKPMTAAEIAQQLDTKVYTIGVGSHGRALSPVNVRSDGQFIFGMAKVEIDEALLQEIAQMTGGQYYRATDEQTLESIYEEINQLEKTEIEVTTLKRYSEEYRWWAVIGMCILLLETILRISIFKSIP